MMLSIWKLYGFFKKETNLSSQNDYSNFALEVQMQLQSLHWKLWDASILQRVGNASNVLPRHFQTVKKRILLKNSWPSNVYQSANIDKNRSNLALIKFLTIPTETIIRTTIASRPPKHNRLEVSSAFACIADRDFLKVQLFEIFWFQKNLFYPFFVRNHQSGRCQSLEESY